MFRFALLVVLFSAPVYAQSQDSATAARSAAGCGSIEVKFDTKTDKKSHPVGTADAGKALIYVIADDSGNRNAINIGPPPSRIGIDGSWVAAAGFRSYVFFQVEPGDHHLCTDSQMITKGLSAKSTMATSFTAVAGQAYFFRIIPGGPGTRNAEAFIEATDPAEALALIANTAHSTFEQKK